MLTSLRRADGPRSLLFPLTFAVFLSDSDNLRPADSLFSPPRFALFLRPVERERLTYLRAKTVRTCIRPP
jgi:hypothetical protein